MLVELILQYLIFLNKYKKQTYQINDLVKYLQNYSYNYNLKL